MPYLPLVLYALVLAALGVLVFAEIYRTVGRLSGAEPSDRPRRMSAPLRWSLFGLGALTLAWAGVAAGLLPGGSAWARLLLGAALVNGVPTVILVIREVRMSGRGAEGRKS